MDINLERYSGNIPCDNYCICLPICKLKNMSNTIRDCILLKNLIADATNLLKPDLTININFVLLNRTIELSKDEIDGLTTVKYTYLNESFRPFSYKYF